MTPSALLLWTERTTVRTNHGLFAIDCPECGKPHMWFSAIWIRDVRIAGFHPALYVVRAGINQKASLYINILQVK